MMNRSKLVPNKRFEGFAGEWKIKKYNSLLNKSDGIRRGPFGSALKKEFFVRSSNYVVYEQQNAIYDRYNTRYNITKEKYDELYRFIINEDDFIMSGAGTIGRISRVPSGVKSGVINQALIRIRVNKSIVDLEYFLQWMRSEEMQNKLTQANPASAMVNLVPMSEVKEWEISVPSIEEQQKIGQFFKHLDDMIALQQKKIDKTKALKSAYLVEMFPAEGERVPKRRFAGFTDSWELCQLKELVELENGHAFKSKYFQTGITKAIVITPGNVKIGGGFQDGKGRYYDVSGSFPQKSVMKPGDIFVTMTDLTPSAQTLGFPALIPADGNLYLHNQRLGKLINYDVNKDFLFNLLCTEQYRKQIVMTASGTTVKHSSPQRILSSLVGIPSIEEQQVIAEFFGKIDETITNQQQKLDKLKSMKQAYLQEMFV